MNTRINYLYRDADNYKMPNSCVVIGEISEVQIAEVICFHLAYKMDCLPASL